MDNQITTKNRQAFVIPFVDQDMSFWENLSTSYQDDIKEVYFPLTDDLIGTGRPHQPDTHLLKFLESEIFPVSVLVNPVVLPFQAEEVFDRLAGKLEFYQNNYRLVGITLANLSLAEKVKNNFPDLVVTASTLMEIYNEQQLVMIDEVFDVLVPSNRITRDLESLRKIRANFNGRIRFLVNESCLPSCVYRTQHFYEMSNPAIAYPCSLCDEMLKKKPWLRLTGGWVLPQHLELFEGLYDEIKLAGRISLQQAERYHEVLSGYVHRLPLNPNQIGGGPAAVHFPIEIETGFYNYTLKCGKNCGACSVCEEYWIEKVENHG